MPHPILAFLLGLLLLSTGACVPATVPAREDVNLDSVGDFALTERDGSTVRKADLLGKVWVASFVFTRCTGPCPQVTATMARLQSDLHADDTVRLVTFTVDPGHDKPDELKRYADNFRADPKRWLFLTGDQDAIYRLLREGFKVPVEQNQGEDRKPGQEVMHSAKLVVVDKRGHLRGYFNGVLETGEDMDASKREFEENYKRLLDKVHVLARETP
jgi:cytochrome oxidase Cu insertion factor (SCO1/SenC/PrrC family)